MKKTLIITLEYPPQIGGIATYTQQMAEVLDAEKNIVYAPPHQDQKIWDNNQHYKILRQRPYFPPFIWPRWLRLFFQVRKIVKKEKIELIIIHHVLPVGYIGILIKKIYKVPFLIFSHGTDLLSATKNSWKTKMLKTVCKNTEQIIFNSESLKRRFLSILPDFDSKSIVVYPCPDKDFFEPPKPEIIEHLKSQYALEGKKVILSVSRLDDGKGFPHLVRLMPEILKKIPNLVWFIIGDGPKQKQIIDLIQKHSLQNVVRFIGEIDHEELKKYYYLADLFVLLTHPDEGREEGLGLVFLEAAAAGLPVVAGKSGGVEEAVIDGKTGLIIDVHQNLNKAGTSIIKILNTPEYASLLANAGKARMQTEFDWKLQLKKLQPWLEI